MLSIHFNEDCWSYLVVDDRRSPEDTILATIHNESDAIAAKKMYENQIMSAKESLAQHFDAVYSDDDGPSWRTEDVLGGE